MPEAATNDPITVMLWGITPERLQEWARAQDGAQIELRGSPAAPGVVEGSARIVKSVDQMADVRDGEILVCGSTSPAWAPIFSRITATVTDIGGVMSHAAIVCREYGLPAVVGTGRATAQIRTGQRIRVDGSAGTVTILDGDGAAASTRHTRPLAGLRAADTPRFGGKSTSLGELLAAGIPVPPGFALSTGAFHAFLTAGGLEARIGEAIAGVRAGRRGHVQAAADTIRAAVCATAVPEDVRAEIAAPVRRARGAAGRGALERGRRGQRRGDVRRPAGDVPLGPRRRRACATRCATAGRARTARRR